jgi:tetratricopeptide (TPR) repeat protein
MEKAEVHLRDALRWNDKDQKSRRLLALVLNDLSRPEDAVAVWRELDTALDGDADALRNIAGLSLQLKRPEDALAAFRRLLEIEPDPDEIARLEAAVGELKQNGGTRP